MDQALERVHEQLHRRQAGAAIAEMETYLAAWPQPQTAEKLAAVKSEYDLMVGYWCQGAHDPALEEQYQRLLQRIYVLYANVAIHRRIKASSFLTALSNSVRAASPARMSTAGSGPRWQSGRGWSLTEIRREMENFVSEVALLQLEPADQRDAKTAALYRNHQLQQNSLFNYIVTSHIWTEGIGKDLQDILLSPTVDANDQQLLVSAVTLSLLGQFDMVKFRLLADTYCQSQDEAVRQRALVGLVLVIDDDGFSIYPEAAALLSRMLQSDAVCRELTELQVQLFYALNTEKDNSTIRKEIMPDLLRNNSFRITRTGLEETEDAPMEDILHPGASEERMEKLEASFQRMKDMQKQGSDIYFGGFSQMKRFPFFSTMSNWLTPFYEQHPDISHVYKSVQSNTFVPHLLHWGTFCDSDKYSLVLAMQQVIDRLPQNMLKSMEMGELSPHELNDDAQDRAASLRRAYVMDLYRFFRLFPNRSALRNPFASPVDGGSYEFFSHQAFSNTPLEPYKRDVVRALLKLQQRQEAAHILATFPAELRDLQYYLWQKDYESALALAPDNERALAGHARLMFSREQYAAALADYEQLSARFPEKSSYLLNKAVCQVNMAAYEDALKLLFQLAYERPDDDNVSRVLAWTLTCSGKLQQAARAYEQLTARTEPIAEDFLNHGYCLWLQGDARRAADSFRQYARLVAESESGVTFDEAWLTARGVSATEIKLMNDLIVNG